jgi:hypothetical protein
MRKEGARLCQLSQRKRLSHGSSLWFTCVHPLQELVLLLEEVQKGAAVYGKVPVLVSRNKPEMAAAILSTLVGEIKIGEVRIAATAREPGVATKLVVEGVNSSVRKISLTLPTVAFWNPSNPSRVNSGRCFQSRARRGSRSNARGHKPPGG